MKDKFCCALAQVIIKPNDELARKKRWITPQKFILVNHVWHFVRRSDGKRKCLPVLPLAMLSIALEISHDGDSERHCDFRNTYGRMADNYWFPKMKRNILEYCLRCLMCKAVSIEANNGAIVQCATRTQEQCTSTSENSHVRCDGKGLDIQTDLEANKQGEGEGQTGTRSMERQSEGLQLRKLLAKGEG